MVLLEVTACGNGNFPTWWSFSHPPNVSFPWLSSRHSSSITALDVELVLLGLFLQCCVKFLQDGNITMVSGLWGLQSLFKGLATITEDHWYDKRGLWMPDTALCAIPLCAR